MDDTPRYMFWADRIPARIQCVSPSAKLIALLRNPVERAYSHYVFSVTEDFHYLSGKMLKMTFDEWVQHDASLLQKAGVLDDPYNIETWKQYVRTMDDQSYSVLGKSLYSIQLRHWYNAMDDDDNLLVLEASAMLEETQETYNAVTDFLGLESHGLRNHEMAKKHASHYFCTEPMSIETKQWLQDFFRPFNEDLYELLEWEPMWE